MGIDLPNDSSYAQRVRALAVMLVLSFVPMAQAIAQTAWKILDLTNTTAPADNIQIPTTVFATKAQALAVLHALDPPYSGVLTQESVIGMSDSLVTYEYAPPKGKPSYSPWTYGYGAGEDQFVSEFTAYYSALCVGFSVSMEATSDWVTQDPTTYWAAGLEAQYKTFMVHTNGCFNPFSKPYFQLPRQLLRERICTGPMRTASHRSSYPRPPADIQLSSGRSVQCCYRR